MRPFARFRAVLPRAASLFIYRLLPTAKNYPGGKNFAWRQQRQKIIPPPFSGGGA
jgi:hypothetical protein